MAAVINKRSDFYPLRHDVEKTTCTIVAKPPHLKAGGGGMTGCGGGRVMLVCPNFENLRETEIRHDRARP